MAGSEPAALPFGDAPMRRALERSRVRPSTDLSRALSPPSGDQQQPPVAQLERPPVERPVSAFDVPSLCKEQPVQLGDRVDPVAHLGLLPHLALLQDASLVQT